MDGCQFCLQNDLIKGEIIYQDDLIYFLSPDIPGIDYNGGMIVTKRHIETPFDMSQEEWARIYEKLSDFKKVLDKLNPDGYNLGWNIGKAAGQIVNHAHLHFFGRFADEPLAGKGIRYAFKQPSNKRK
jgi:histidine triad (HIT) family protein